MNQPLRTGLRSLYRDWRSGELRMLVWSVVLAVSALSTVAFFANRMTLGLERDALALLGGDAVVVSDRDTPAWVLEAAAREGLAGVKTSQFPTMAQAEPRSKPQAGQPSAPPSRLVALKAVAPGYPLRGQIQLQTSSNTSPAKPALRPATGSIPDPGEVWVDAALLDALELQIGQRLSLGDASLRVTAIIAREPDRGVGFMNFAPRVMMNEADLPATHLVQPASRITWRYAVAGDSVRVKRFRAETERRIQAEVASPQMRGLRVESLESGRPEMRQTLDRAEKFLQLVALLTTLLCALAVAMACRGFAQRRLDDCAMLRVLGQSQSHIAWSYTVEFSTVGLLASAAGVALGFGLHHLLIGLAQNLLTSLPVGDLPAPDIWPAILGLGTGMVLTLGFGLPPVLQLARVPALRVMRRDVGPLRGASLGVLSLGALGFAALLLVVSGDLRLGALAVGGFAVAVGCFASLAWLAVKWLRRCVGDLAPQALRLATRQIAARPGLAVVQVSALAVGLLCLALLALLRTDLIQSWRQATPSNAPNRFVINIQPDQAPAFQQVLRENGVQGYDWYPMIRGRLIAINGQAVTPERYSEERARRLVDREFNLSHSATLPAHNPVVAGRWTHEEEEAISVEEGLAKTLKLQLGDTLEFDIAGISSRAHITSLRKVDWASMRVNFFVIYPRSVMPVDQPWPTTYISAFRTPANAARGFDNALVRQFPNITLVNTEATLQQVQDVLGQVMAAVEYLFAFALTAGLLVLVATISTTRAERTREYALMRALGAGSGLLRRVQRLELAGVGFIAGFLAGAMALAIGWALARFVFEFDWVPRLWMPLACAVAGAGLALVAGQLSLRQVLRTPVVSTLREASF